MFYVLEYCEKQLLSIQTYQSLLSQSFVASIIPFPSTNRSWEWYTSSKIGSIFIHLPSIDPCLEWYTSSNKDLISINLSLFYLILFILSFWFIFIFVSVCIIKTLKLIKIGSLCFQVVALDPSSINSWVTPCAYNNYKKFLLSYPITYFHRQIKWIVKKWSH